jgi:sRNA-binding protein
LTVQGRKQMSDTNSKAPPRDSAVDAAIALFAETWPATFSVYERRRRPLALGIHHSILAALEGAITPEELRRALRYYTGNPFYLRATVAGAERIGLDGSPAGTVTAEEAAAAAGRLAGYQKKRRASSVPATASIPTPPPTPARIGLADLRRAAELRRSRNAAAA